MSFFYIWGLTCVHVTAVCSIIAACRVHFELVLCRGAHSSHRKSSSPTSKLFEITMSLKVLDTMSIDSKFHTGFIQHSDLHSKLKRGISSRLVGIRW